MKKKLFSILFIFIGINCCFHIYSINISLYLDDKPFCDWFKDKKLSPSLQNDVKLLEIVIPDKNEDIKIEETHDLSGTEYCCYNRLNLVKLKEILGINEGRFIVLLEDIKILYNKNAYNSKSIAIWIENSNYKIIDINFGSHTGIHEFLDKDKIYVCRDKNFSVYKIDLTDLKLQIHDYTSHKEEVYTSVTTPVVKPEVKSVKNASVTTPVKTPVKTPVINPVVKSVVKPVVKPVVPQVVKPEVKSVKNTLVTTPVKTPVKTPVVKSGVKSGVKSVVPPEVKPEKNASVTTPVINPVVKSVVLKGKDTDLSDSTTGNITGSSTIGTTCSCRRNN